MAHSFSGPLFQCLTTLMGKIFSTELMITSCFPAGSLLPLILSESSLAVFSVPSPEAAADNSKILPLHPSLPAPILSVCSDATQFLNYFPAAAKQWPLLRAEVMGAAQSCDPFPITHLDGLAREKVAFSVQSVQNQPQFWLGGPCQSPANKAPPCPIHCDKIHLLLKTPQAPLSAMMQLEAIVQSTAQVLVPGHLQDLSAARRMSLCCHLSLYFLVYNTHKSVSS